MNTTAQVAEGHDIKERLAQLAEYDPFAAQQIQNSFRLDSLGAGEHDWNSGQGEFKRQASALMDVTGKIRHWLAENEKAPDIVIVPGIGAGNKIEGLLSLLPEETKILLLEQDISRAKELFLRCNIEDYVKENRLKVALGSDETHIETQLLPMLDMPKCPTIQILDSADLPADDQKFYESVLHKIRNNIRVHVTNVCTLVTNGPLWQYNTIKNLPRLISEPGINQLDNLFPGKPAIIVAAGPSLNRVLPVLHEISKKFVMISTGTGLKSLRAAGIKPDLVVSVDASKKTGEQFTIECGDLFLACSWIIYPPILPKFRGIFNGCINLNPIIDWAASFNEPKGIIFAGGTVTATAIDLAVKMGCNPVITVGLDLSVAEDGTTHADHTMYHGERYKTEQLMTAPGNYRETVFTTGQFFVYIKIISSYVEHHKNTRFLNVTDAGAKIKGMELHPVAELNGLGCEHLDAFAKIREKYETYNPPAATNALVEIKKIIDQMEEVKTNAVQAAMICNELIMAFHSPYGRDKTLVHQKLGDLKEIDDRIMTAKESSAVLNMSLRPIYYAMGGNPGKEEKQRYSGAIVEYRRSRQLYEQIAGAAKWTRELFLEAVDKIEKGRQ